MLLNIFSLSNVGEVVKYLISAGFGAGLMKLYEIRQANKRKKNKKLIIPDKKLYDKLQEVTEKYKIYVLGKIFFYEGEVVCIHRELTIPNIPISDIKLQTDFNNLLNELEGLVNQDTLSLIPDKDVFGNELYVPVYNMPRQKITDKKLTYYFIKNWAQLISDFEIHLDNKLVDLE